MLAGVSARALPSGSIATALIVAAALIVALKAVQAQPRTAETAADKAPKRAPESAPDPAPGRAQRAEAKPRVVLVSPEAAGSARAAALLRAELRASGFEVVTTDPRGVPEAEREGALAIVTSDPGGRAAAEILLRAPESPSGERHLIDLGAVSGLPEGDATRALTTMAVRVGELLRARSVALPGRPAPRPSPTAEAVGIDAAPPPASDHRYALRFELGAAAGVSVREAGAALGPRLGLAARASSGLGLALSVATLALGGRVLEGSNGSARLVQSLGLVSAFYEARPFGDRLTQRVLLGVGPQQIFIDGTGRAPYVGQTDSIWMFVVDAGAEVAARLGGPVSLLLGAHAFRALPSPVIAIGPETAGQGAPLAYHGYAALSFGL
jgi:hypothetical protein